MKKFIHLYSLILFFGIVSCEETVELDVKQAPSNITIEGLITNEYRHHYVAVKRTVDFYANGGAEPIADAIVTVSDGTNEFEFVHNPDFSDGRTGYYFSPAFAGEVGKTYYLTVNVDGETFTAQDVLYPVTEIDSLSYVLDEDEREDPEVEGRFYEVLFYAKEPQETKDYYLFKFYRNDSLIFDDETDIYFSNDDLLAEEINGIPTASYYKIGDVAKVEMYSISNAGFIFYNDLINLLKSDGGMFGSPPVNPRNNISGGALGFFQASSLVSETIEIIE